MNEKVANPVMDQVVELPAYEPPRLQVMSERDILNTFQITQSMNTWWIMGTTCPCT
ncbi:MAG TPA: hypothetical protein VKH35_10745 [Thermoanaerobaculia bacterium]|nr:hypothetical protein [Thermoanaerobaculia bacterium]